VRSKSSGILGYAQLHRWVTASEHQQAPILSTLSLLSLPPGSLKPSRLGKSRRRIDFRIRGAEHTSKAHH
jgi:hypothetical protein